MELLKKLLHPGNATPAGTAPPRGAPSPAAQQDRGPAVRQRQCNMAGFIWSEAMLAPRPCNIKNMTPKGAEIEIWDETMKRSLLDHPLKLYSSTDGREVNCVMVWRKGMVIGLEFDGKFHAPSRKYS